VSQTQNRNSQMVDLLSTEFQRRYEPNFSAGNAASAFLMLPALRAFWTCGSAIPAELYDISGAVRTLTRNGTTTIAYRGLAPIIEFNGTTGYMNRSDANLRLTASHTFGGWFKFDNDTPAATEFLMGVRGTATAAQIVHALIRLTTSVIRYQVSDATTIFPVGTTAITSSSWAFVVGRYTASTSIELFVNNTYVTNTTTIPASLNTAAYDFTIGASSVPSDYLDGRASMCFACNAAIPTRFIRNLYHTTRALFNV